MTRAEVNTMSGKEPPAQSRLGIMLDQIATFARKGESIPLEITPRGRLGRRKTASADLNIGFIAATPAGDGAIPPVVISVFVPTRKIGPDFPAAIVRVREPIIFGKRKRTGVKSFLFFEETRSDEIRKNRLHYTLYSQEGAINVPFPEDQRELNDFLKKEARYDRDWFLRGVVKEKTKRFRRPRFKWVNRSLDKFSVDPVNEVEAHNLLVGLEKAAGEFLFD